jgi:hypothetical protein
MRKQLAVEWLVNQIAENLGIRVMNSSMGASLLEQAKEIESNGKQESYDNGYANGQKDAFTQ